MGLYRESIDFIIRSATRSPYFLLPEQDPRWQRFLAATPKNRLRSTAMSLRRVGNSIADARANKICLYCWLPTCMCDAIKRLEKGRRAALLLGQCAAPVMLVHQDEFLRPSNSGHICAIAVDAPLVVWGLPEHDAIMDLFPYLHVEEYELFYRIPAIAGPLQGNDDSSSSTEEKADPLVAAAEAGARMGDICSAQHMTLDEVLERRAGPDGKDKDAPVVAALYPKEGVSIPLQDFVATHCSPSASCSSATTVSSTAAASAAAAVADDDADSQKQQQQKQQQQQQHRRRPVVLILLDSTWGAAHRLARHLPPPEKLPRVVINLSENFGSGMFAALRKRTRADGCSTLEATAMALEQVLEANRVPQEDVAAVTNTLLWDMSLFVDVVFTIKRIPGRAHQLSQDPEIVAAVAQICGIPLHDYRVERMKEITSHAPARPSVEQLMAEGIMAPPWLRYCYVCASYVSCSRMVEHCTGVLHRERFAAKYSAAREQVLKETSPPPLEDEEEIRRRALGKVWYPSASDQDNEMLPSAAPMNDEIFQEQESRRRQKQHDE